MAALLALESLPQELLCRISHLLNPKDARSMRLSCRRLCPAATQSLFSVTCLSPRNESRARFRQICDSPKLKTLVRHVELTMLDQRLKQQLQAGSTYPPYHIDTETLELFNIVTTLNLHSLALCLTRGVRQFDLDYRPVFLQSLLRILAAPCDSTITDLSINNLVLHEQFDPELFSPNPESLSSLEKMRLSFYTDLEFPIPRDITTPLRSLWLQPTVESLTTLVLYHDTPFGFIPKLDLRGLHFPNLITLSLGNYCFLHDWQLEWISSHASTLENLFLDFCRVIFFRGYPLEKDNPDADYGIDEEGYPTEKTEEWFSRVGRDSRYSVNYKFNDMTWERIIAHFETHLTSLRHCRIGVSPQLPFQGSPFDPWDKNMYDSGPPDYFKYERIRQGFRVYWWIASHTYVGCDVEGRGSSFMEFPRTDPEGSSDFPRIEAFAADAQGVQMGRDNEALVSLLQKIGQDPQLDEDSPYDEDFDGFY